MATEHDTTTEQHGAATPETIEVPAPTAWPMFLSLGVALIFAGLIMHWALLIVGLVMAVMSGAGWIWETLPGSGVMAEERVPPHERPRPIEAKPGTVEQMNPDRPGYRMQLPVKMHPYSAGIKGGIVGGIVMPIPAAIFGILGPYHSLWYPINVLAGTLLPRMANADIQALKEFDATGLAVGLLIHVVASLGVGLIYGVILPTLPGKPIVWGAVILPMIWSGTIYGLTGVVNPEVAGKVDWYSFTAAQFVYGLAAGIVVVRSEQVYINKPPEVQASEGHA